MDTALRFDKLRQGGVSNNVYELLRDAIIQLKLRPGNPLSESDLAQRLDVSRQPVREAFIKLAEAGLVEVRPQRGTYVLLISRREVETARFVREAVEVAFARKAAREATDADHAALRQSLALQLTAGEAGDNVAFLRHDEAFHRAISKAAGCESAWKPLETIKAQLDRVRFLSFPETTPLATLIAQHQAIADALAARDPDAAEATMRRHLGEILNSLPRIAEAHPDLFTD